MLVINKMRIQFRQSAFTPTSSRLRRVKVVSPAFTIVELLVVIVVIGILAAITIIAYTGITKRATAAGLISDLDNASKQLKLYQVEHSAFPVSLNDSNCPLDSTSIVDNTYCLKASSGNIYTYQPSDTTNPQAFRLYSTNGSARSLVSNSSAPIATSLVCPSGFIVVPGSTTYNTSDFCVMKYEAKRVGSSTTPISTATGLPWVIISQTTAITNSPNVAGCTDCHLITEAEWMTIAQNVLNVASNWSGGSVGSGYIYSGHNDNAPAKALEASTDDTLGYTGTGNSSSSGANQKRTLTLTNGEVIWDMAGNVYDWTAGTTTGGQPGVVGNVYASWIQWPNVTTSGILSPSPFPADTAIAGAGTWTSANGIGQLSSNPAETGARSFLRGGAWGYGSGAGVLSLLLDLPAGSAYADLGFRVSR